MPPNEGNGRKIEPVVGRHLELVQTPAPGPGTLPDPETPISSTAPTLAPEGIEIPVRFSDLAALRSVINGVASPTPYSLLQDVLPEVASRRPDGSLDFSLKNSSLTYHITQEAPGRPFVLSASQIANGTTTPKLRLEILPDGKFTSDLKPEIRSEMSVSAERTHFGIFRNLLLDRGQLLMNGNDLFWRMRTALEGLQGQYHADSNTVRFDNFVLSKGTLYSFELQNPIGPKEVLGDTQYSQIKIYSETQTATGSQRSLVASVSSTGEINYSADSRLRIPPSPEQISLFKGLTTSLERAHDTPETYHGELTRAFARTQGLQGRAVPTIAHSIAVPSDMSRNLGVLGEPILTFNSGSDLFSNFHPWARHRWQNPADATDVRNLHPNWRLSRTMAWELLRWGVSTAKHRLFAGLFDPKPNTDYLRLHLYPEGGGELNIYRNNELFDILFSHPDGSTWRAGREIRSLEKGGQTFSSRLEGLKAAVARYNMSDPTRPSLQVQVAPLFDLDRLHLNADGSVKPIRDTRTAWEVLQGQIPSGIQPRVQSQLNLLGQAESVQVDFAGSNPSQTLKIKSFQIPTPSGDEIPRVEIFLQRGHDAQTRVFEDGTLRPELSRDILQRYLSRAQEGRHGGRWYQMAGEAAHFYFIRRTGYALANGIPFTLGHFISLPLIRAYEGAAYTEAERRVVGTPSAQLTPEYLYSNVLKPYFNFTLFTGASAVFTDSVFNAIPGVRRAMGIRAATSASWTEAISSAKISGLNPNPIRPPIRENIFMRGMQRAVPLFVGLTALEYFEHGNLRSPYFLSNMANVGMVSAGSVALTELVTRVGFLSRGARAIGLVEAASAGTGGATFGLTMRGNILLAAMEFTVLGILGSRDRRAAMEEVRNGLRGQVGQALDRRNELITRLEHGEEIAPRLLVAADQELTQAQGVYRRFMEMDEKTSGTGSFQALGLDNDFQDQYELGGASAFAPSGDLGSDMARAGLALRSENRLSELRGRYDQMEGELASLYQRYGVAPEAPQQSNESLRDFLTRVTTQAGDTTGSGATSTSAVPATPSRSPIALNTPEADMILDHWRWKAAQDPSFILWSPERRAGYLLRQFRGYRVEESDGSSRPWNQGEALAFLSLVDQANAERGRNMQDSLTIPRSEDGYNTARLDELLSSERLIRQREMEVHGHAREHAGRLATNIPDFDRQMESYYTMSNQRLGVALQRFVEPPQARPLLARAD